MNQNVFYTPTCPTCSLQQEISPVQMEFFSEDELVTIIPSQTLATPDSRLICIGVNLNCPSNPFMLYG